MKLLLLFDSSIQNVDQGKHLQDLKKFSPDISTNESDNYDEFNYDTCVYFMSAEAGISGSQCQTVINNASIGHWLLVLVNDTTPGMGSIAPQRRKLNINLASLPIVYEVTENKINDTKQIELWLNIQVAAEEILPDHIDTTKRLCLLISKKNYVWEKGFFEMLKRQLTKYEVINALDDNSEKLKQYKKLANKIIFFGADVSEFDFHKVESAENRAVFYIDSMGMNPVYYHNIPVVKKLILDRLNSKGWNLPSAGTERIYVGSSLYQSCVDQGEIESTIVLFDKFGLPLPHKEYRMDQLIERNKPNELRRIIEALQY